MKTEANFRLTWSLCIYDPIGDANLVHGIAINLKVGD